MVSRTQTIALAICAMLVFATIAAAAWLMWLCEDHRVAPSAAQGQGDRDEASRETLDIWDEEGWLHSYLGTLDGTVRIGMTVERRGGSIRGLYFEVSDLVDHRVEMHLGAGRAVEFVVLDPNGQVAATFRGEFARTDPAGNFYNGAPLQQEVIVGSLSMRSPPATRDVYLSLSHCGVGCLENMYSAAGVVDDRVVNERAVMLQRAVADHDRASVARMVRFPISIRIGARWVQLSSEDRFLEVYDRVFTRDFASRIAEAIPHHMFSKYSGVMLGQGEVWFNEDGSIGAINTR